MKDTSSSNRHPSRTVVYPKKRPSPHGIVKHPKSSSSPLLSPRTSSSAKSAQVQRRQRDAQILAWHREGILIEEEYRQDIRYYMYQMERYTMSSIKSMDQQPEVRWDMRPRLVDFLVEIHFTFRLRPETLYLTLNIVDRYMSRRIVYVKHYQLIGCAALWIAAKFEDAKDRVPTVQDLASICHGTYEESAFVQMEGHVLSTIQWTLGHPTAEAWLRLITCESCMEDAKVQHVARFLMEITLFYREFVNYTPSAIANAALTLARFLCDRERRSSDETDECMEVVQYLDHRLAKHVSDLSEILVKKYSYSFYSKAATFVVQFYLQGGRFMRPAPMFFPVTPLRAASASTASTPMSAATSASDLSDDMPLTPTSPTFSSSTFSSSDPFSSLCSEDKENVDSTFEPVINKHRVDAPPEQFLPHDFVTFGRTALHLLNSGSPHPTSVS